MSTALIQNGTIVTASERYQADIYVEGGVISLIGRALSLPAATVIDASGRLVLPGGVDVHTHLDMAAGQATTSDDFETGTIAAAHGGTTTIVDFASQAPGEGLGPALEARKKQAEGKAVIDYAFHLAVHELTEAVAEDMDRMVRHEGVTSFKLFMAYPGVHMVDDATVFRAMRRTRENGGLVCLHAENGGVIQVLVQEALARGDTAPRFHALTRPTETEAEATARAVALAEMAGAPVYVVHVSCAEALDAIRRARSRGMQAYAETCPQYLLLSSEEYEREGFEGAKFVMSPPLRETRHQQALWEGLARGEVQVVATDHCPFCMDRPPHKRVGQEDFSKIPGGAPGVETRLPLLWDAGVRAGRIDAHRFVEVTATNPAKLLGLWPRKGAIAIGSDADLLVWDPDREVSLSAAALHMRVDYSPYEGRTVRGGPVTVLSRGEVIVDRGEFRGQAGRGQFVKRKARKSSPA